jgi:uncharacterized membrane protein
MTLLITGLVLFLGAHVFTRATPLRAAVVGRFGAMRYRAVHSLLSLAGFIAIIVGFGQARAENAVQLWTPPPIAATIALVAMAPALILLLLPYAPGKLRATIPHPMMLGVIIWSGAHLLANGDLPSALLFGGFFLWAVVARVLVGFTPRASAPWSVADGAVVAVGLGLWFATATWLHPMLIGVPVLGT